MASSSTRLTKADIEEQRNKSFTTIIDPHKAEIAISQKFKYVWHHKLENEPVAYLVHPSGNTAWLEFHLGENQCYMTCGKIASLLFGFREPTEVVLTYHEKYTSFTLRKTTAVTSNYENGESLVEANMKFQNNTYTLHQYENDQLFGWEQRVSKALASETKNQVLRIPPNTAKSALRGRNSIIIKTQHSLDGLKWSINTYTIENGRKERYFTEGWYAFKKANNLGEGDKLQFQLSDPADVMIVEIVRSNNSE